MTEHGPTELERAVARAILLRRGRGRAMPEARMLELLADPLSNESAAENVREVFLDARAAIAECFRRPHTNLSVPCPLCGFVVRKVEQQPFVFDEEP